MANIYRLVSRPASNAWFSEEIKKVECFKSDCGSVELSFQNELWMYSRFDPGSEIHGKVKLGERTITEISKKL